MLILALWAQLALRPDTDSVYATVALRRMVERAAAANRQPPASLRGYNAQVETELSLVVRDTVGREDVAQIEQLASAATWSRSGAYDLHVVGSRSQSVGLPLSALSVVRGWTVPMLYGNQLRLGIEGPRGGDAVVVRGRGSRRDTLPVVHPFAANRDRYYRFRGGDTVAVLHTPSRDVSIARLLVEPRVAGDRRIASFRGEIDVDAERGEVVRMRGRFEYPAVPDHGWRALSARATGLVAAAFVEFVNSEVDGRYWLPAYQRTEFQATAALLGPERSILRVVSRFSGYALDTLALGDPTAGAAGLATARVTFAPADSINAYHGWREPLGRGTSTVTGGDFDDLAPDPWRATGLLEVVPYPRRFGDVLRYNRVEGAYAGLAGEVRFRDAAPGLVARGFAGWAWTERTMRGGASMTLRRGSYTYGLRGERALASTNDFRAPLDGGASLGALLGSVDDEDYVDRRIASVSAARSQGASDRILANVELGVGEDRPEIARLPHGLVSAGTRFRVNRGSVAGRYARAAFDVEYHPNVSGDFLEPGLGAHLHVEHGQGELDWTRAELALGSRAYWNDLWLAVRANGGVVVGAAMPPQTLFEIGGIEGLPGYAYKEFGGDRAALARLAAGYTFPVLRSPRRLIRGYVLPGISPGLAAGLQGGWAEARTSAARSALRLLGAVPDSVTGVPEPVSVPTRGVRATVDLRLTFFSGAVSVGIARPLDHAAGWRGVAALGQSY